MTRGHPGGLPRRAGGPDPWADPPAIPKEHGVKAIRRGKPIPAGYVLVGQKVEVQRGAETAGAALRFTCPDGKRLKTFGVTGQAGCLASQNYEDHRTTNVMSFPPPHQQQASGTVYAVCR